MRTTQPVPSCPQCGAKVYRSHTCRRSGLTPPPPHLALVPMPAGFRDRLAAELHPEPEPEQPALWPDLAQLHLVEPVDLDWQDAFDQDNGL